MSNIVQLHSHPRSEAQDIAGLSKMFASQRRTRGDVFWLKENAEWLGMLATMPDAVPDQALAPYAAFYDDMRAQLAFFPQYYRFFLSLCLDLEDLGLGDTHGLAMCDLVAAKGLPDAELSDLQRAEAERLLARRLGTGHDQALRGRLHRFISRSQTFVLPNKKAAYELAHIVFYLSDYGKCDPQLSAEALVSLEYAGLLAFLDQNADLLAEICAALRFAGVAPSLIWERLVLSSHRECTFQTVPSAGTKDIYHSYLVTGWVSRLAGERAFTGHVPAGPVAIAGPAGGGGPLRDLSQGLFDLGARRSADWAIMRERLCADLPDSGHTVLEAAMQSSDRFEAFFEGFARAVPGAVGGIDLM